MSDQSGDRAAFLARIRERQGPPPAGGPHPPPPPPDVVPAMRYRNLDDVADRAGLIDVFTATARAADADVVAGGRIASSGGTAPADVALAPDVDGFADLEAVVAGVIAAHGIATAVLSREPEAQATADLLRRLDVTVDDYTPELAASADLAVTSATHGIAATGSVVVDSLAAGSRAVSLLPRVHLCLLSADRIVASPADVLRHPEPDGMPSCRVLITGPSRTGDIEQRLIRGAHGPVAVHIVVLPG